MNLEGVISVIISSYLAIHILMSPRLGSENDGHLKDYNSEKYVKVFSYVSFKCFKKLFVYRPPKICFVLIDGPIL